MPFVLIILGALMTTVGVKGTQGQLITLLKGDLTGSNNFVDWLVSILVIGAIGYVPGLKKISDGLLILVLLVLVLVNKGFFTQFSTAVKGGT